MRVNSTDLQNAFGKYLAMLEKEDIIVVKNGKNVAKLTKYTVPDYAILHEEAMNYKTTRRKITYEEYEALVESSDQRYELIGGEVYLLAAPSYSHQVVVNEIAGRFYNYFRDKSCQPLTSPFDVRLFGFAAKFMEDPNVVQPDIVVVCDKDKVQDNKYHGVPTLIVEVLSPSTKGKDLATKLELYRKSGVSEYWIVDPDAKQLTFYSFTAEREVAKFTTFFAGDVVSSETFKGLELSVQEIFADL
ncbi:MAG: Uma2 family endonuclease [Firmicutes bacterium]|nr:Uma2 family endonuclease [Bacillota bacterium]